MTEYVRCARCGASRQITAYCTATEECREAMRRDVQERAAYMAIGNRRRTAAERRADQRAAAEIFLGVRPSPRTYTPILAAYF